MRRTSQHNGRGIGKVSIRVSSCHSRFFRSEIAQPNDWVARKAIFADTSQPERVSSTSNLAGALRKAAEFIFEAGVEVEAYRVELSWTTIQGMGRRFQPSSCIVANSNEGCDGNHRDSSWWIDDLHLISPIRLGPRNSLFQYWQPRSSLPSGHIWTRTRRSGATCSSAPPTSA